MQQIQVSGFNQAWQIFMTGQLIFCIIGVVGIYINMRIRIKILEQRMKVGEKRTLDVEEADKKMIQKIDKVAEDVSFIRGLLQHKS